MNYKVFKIPDFEALCPVCQTLALQINDLLFDSAYPLACYTCIHCKTAFKHTIPIGHAAHFPVSFSVHPLHVYAHHRVVRWLGKQLPKSYTLPPLPHVQFQQIKKKHSPETVLFNCLDDCYGHVFYKLLNAFLYVNANPEAHVSVLIPANVLWLVPEAVSEIWIVHTSLSNLKFRIAGLHEWVFDQCHVFNRVYLHPLVVHPAASIHDIEQYLGYKRFGLQGFVSNPIKIAFVWRTDRLWLPHTALHYIVKLYKRVSALRFMEPILLWFQFRQFELTAKRIQKHYPDMQCYIAGIGIPIGSSVQFTDLRVPEVTDATEHQWCQLYAQCQLVIGVHGSNMIIPSALSAGFINIVPKHKLEHITEDVACTYPNRLALFLSRFVMEPASAKQVAKQAIQILSNFDFYYRNLLQDASSLPNNS